jgi:hypothetical protein
MAAPDAGLLEVQGQVIDDAEFRVGVDGRGLLAFDITTGKGFPYQVRRSIANQAADHYAATLLQHALRRGARVRVYAAGATSRTSHDKAVLQLIDVTDVIPMKEE